MHANLYMYTVFILRDLCCTLRVSIKTTRTYHGAYTYFYIMRWEQGSSFEGSPRRIFFPRGQKNTNLFASIIACKLCSIYFCHNSNETRVIIIISIVRKSTYITIYISYQYLYQVLIANDATIRHLWFRILILK